MTFRVHRPSATAGRGARNARAGFWLFLSTFLVAMIVFVGGAAAAPQCIQQASGVPALSGPPDWWNNQLPAGTGWKRLDDPRWRGAFESDMGATGVSTHVSFRALRGAVGATPALFLSWFVQVDPSIDPFVDVLRVGFTQTGGQPDTYMEITPFNAAPPSGAPLIAVAPAGVDTQVRTGPGGTFASIGTPTWAQPATTLTKIWADTDTSTWAVNMVVPISAVAATGLNLDNDFRLWFEVQVGTPANGVVFYRLPGAPDAGTVLSTANAAAWPEFSRNRPLSDPTCVKGISLTSADVGTTNAQPNKINLTSPNTFFASPQNDTGGSVPGGAINATFRIANWGTQPNWNDVTDPTNTLWSQINPAPVTNGANIANGTKGLMTFNWTPTNAEACQFDTASAGLPPVPGCPPGPKSKRVHQCMLVEMSGAGLSFNPASVYRNMDFSTASTFTREAQVSVAGLTKIPSAITRDVFLYVKTSNLADVHGGGSPASPLVNIGEVLKVTQGDGGDGPVVDVAGAASLTHMTAVAGRGQFPAVNAPFDVASQLYPTYAVHAYHDTGRTMVIRSVTRRVLVPQSSFGYYMYHEGEMRGWDERLTGAIQLTKHYYLVSPPEGGSTNVTTTIRAVLPGEPDPKPDAPLDEQTKGFCASIGLADAGTIGGGVFLAGIGAFWPTWRRRSRGKEQQDR